MSFGQMHIKNKVEVEASLICHETVNPTYQQVYNLDLDCLRLSSGPRKKIRAKKGRAKGINSIQVDSCLPHEQSLVNLLIEGDSACRSLKILFSSLILQCFKWSVTELLKSLEN